MIWVAIESILSCPSLDETNKERKMIGRIESFFQKV